MHNNKNFTQRFLPALIVSLSSFGLSPMAEAEIMLYDKDQTTFSTDGYINAFYVNSDVDRAGEQYDRRQSRVKMGFLPNCLGFNMGKQVDDLKLGARASSWVTINDSETNGTDTAIDVRQFYGTVANPEWGEVLIGKDFGLFARSNILLDELLAGYGQVSDTLGLVDGGGVSFGNIGTGYPYPFPTSQITYRTPVMDGRRGHAVEMHRQLPRLGQPFGAQAHLELAGAHLLQRPQQLVKQAHAAAHGPADGQQTDHQGQRTQAEQLLQGIPDFVDFISGIDGDLHPSAIRQIEDACAVMGLSEHVTGRSAGAWSSI